MAPQQLVYLDESGDPGFKTGSGSSPALVVACVIFDDPADAEATAEAIHAYRRSLGKGGQFHFSSLRRDWRLGFLSAVSQCRFRVRAVVMLKERIWPETHLRRAPRAFYNFTVKLVFRDALSNIHDAKVFVDGDASNRFRSELSDYLRRECNTGGHIVVRQLEFAPKTNVLIQMADMVVGALARSYRHDKADAQECKAALAERIENVWEFGQDHRL